MSVLRLVGMVRQGIRQGVYSEIVREYWMKVLGAGSECVQ
jgi:hypothetical protein